ncbi:MAG TPA: hypothetical protein VGE13_00335 [Candidatus Saccharimonadales bacterium]
MADEPTNQQPISDDQELAKVLAGISQQTEDTPEEEPVVPTPLPEPAVQPEPAVIPDPASMMPPSTEGGLDGIKLEALQELRPLVDKLNVSPEEKFDTYLLLLRSTDDKELIAPAHEAAKGIADEARRAQALLDIIKEIDFLSQPKQ